MIRLTNRDRIEIEERYRELLNAYSTTNTAIKQVMDAQKRYPAYEAELTAYYQEAFQLNTELSTLLNQLKQSYERLGETIDLNLPEAEQLVAKQKDIREEILEAYRRSQRALDE